MFLIQIIQIVMLNLFSEPHILLFRRPLPKHWQSHCCSFKRSLLIVFSEYSLAFSLWLLCISCVFSAKDSQSHDYCALYRKCLNVFFLLLILDSLCLRLLKCNWNFAIHFTKTFCFSDLKAERITFWLFARMASVNIKLTICDCSFLLVRLLCYLQTVNK